MALRKYPTIGCCGIDCGLCPRFYTVGASRCPGCCGEGFEEVHPPCGFITCCMKKHGLNVCAECVDFPCKRFEKETGERDSFVLHRKVMPNQHLIAEIGIGEFVKRQQERISFLETALAHYDDGRSKSLFCIAATLLSAESLKQSLSLAENGAPLKTILNRFCRRRRASVEVKEVIQPKKPTALWAL